MQLLKCGLVLLLLFLATATSKQRRRRAVDHLAAPLALAKRDAKTDAAAADVLVEKSGELATNVLTALNNALDVKKLANLAATLGSFLGFLGPILGIISALIPAGDSPELKYMKKAFNQVNNRLDQLDLKMDSLTHTVKHMTLVSSYKKVINRIENMKNMRSRMMTANFSKSTVDDFINTCRHHNILGLMSWWDTNVVREILAPHYATSILKAGGYNIRILKNWANLMSLHVTEAAIIHSIYESLRSPNGTVSTADQNTWKQQASNIVNYFIRAQNRLEVEFATAPEGLDRFMKHSLMVTYNGVANHWDFAIGTHTYISNKFPFTRFTIFAYNKDMDNQEERYQGGTMRKYDNMGGRSAVVTWGKHLNNRHGRKKAIVTSHQYPGYRRIVPQWAAAGWLYWKMMTQTEKPHFVLVLRDDANPAIIGPFHHHIAYLRKFFWEDNYLIYAVYNN